MKKKPKQELIGLIPAAGKGTRLYPKTKTMSKVLLELGGRPILERNIEIMKNKLKIKKIYIIVGYNKDQIINHFGDGKKFGVKIEYIYNDKPEKGLADGILLAKDYINTPFCVILGDEFYADTNHTDLLKCLNKDFIAVCCVKITINPSYIKKNYALNIEDGVITALYEKPSVVKNDYLGCGTYLFDPIIFKYIEKTKTSKKTGRIEITDTIDLAAATTKKVLPFFITGYYVNVNTINDFNYANFLIRCRKFDRQKISLIIPAFNEEESIGYVVEGFRDRVHEIIVADNNSQDNTAKNARAKGAKVYTAELKGYGDALRLGMSKATGDILVLAEADGSFSSRDIGKILEYMKDADMVIGTRTTKQLIEQGANMNTIVRMGNVLVAKFIEFLYWRKHQPRLTDVGCTYRGIWRDSYERIKNKLTANGPEFAPEMIIETINHNMRIIEIPVAYHGRIGGVSRFSGNIFAISRTAIRMIVLIIKKKIVYILKTYILTS